MNDFTYRIPTEIRFGKNSISCLAEKLAVYGQNVLLVYGGGSIRKSGLYEKVCNLLDGFRIYELSGISPNPKISSVRDGVSICREHEIDVILAVGGGSCIDAAKNIACGVYYKGDPWDLVADGSKITKALPIAVVLTVSATGSEMNNNAIISNEETQEKLGIANDAVYPALSICDPQYLYTLPASQTAAGTADIISHVIEQYFQPYDGAFITDRMCESVLKTCIHYCPIALKRSDDYEARSNLMWASTLGLNHLLTLGKGGAWSCHPMEHELSAFYDITHGVGLAILTPAWMRYILCDITVKRMAMFAENVWGIHTADPYTQAREGIDRLQQFFTQCGLPSTLREVGIGSEYFGKMAEEAVRTSGIANRAYIPLQTEDIVKIYESCAQ